MFSINKNILHSLFILFVSLLYTQKGVDSTKENIGERFLEAAKKYIGVPFVWGGRSKTGLDCMGLPFLAYTDVTGKRWQNLSVYPSKLVKSGKLGKPVLGLDGVLKNSIDYSKLKKGDIIYFLVPNKIGDVDYFIEIDTVKYWVWHMGIFAGNDTLEVPLVLNARPGDKVVIEPLEDIYFDAIFVTRFDYQPSSLFFPAREGDSSYSNRIESRDEIVKNLQKLIADNQLIVIHTFVALCDNEHQGIVKVPPRLGDGNDLKNNLYWGAGGGIKTYFKKSEDWSLVAEWKNVSENVLERCIFKRKNKNVYMIADAYRGCAIKEAIGNFLNAIAGNDTSIITITERDSGISLEIGSVQLVCYAGHNGLLDFNLDSLPKPAQNKKPKDVIILACLSKNTFYDILDSLGGYPLLWTTGLIAPEAYTLKAAIDAWIKLETTEEIRNRVAFVYNKFQKCGLNNAKKLFVSGW